MVKNIPNVSITKRLFSDDEEKPAAGGSGGNSSDSDVSDAPKKRVVDSDSD